MDDYQRIAEPTGPGHELDAARTCVGAMAEISPDAQFRGWFWLGQRLGLLPPPLVGRPVPFPVDLGPNAPDGLSLGVQHADDMFGRGRDDDDR